MTVKNITHPLALPEHLPCCKPSIETPASRPGPRPQVNTQMTEDLPCPTASAIASALAREPEQPATALWDVAEAADAAGADMLEVTLDLQHHGLQSLLQPGLAAVQGPALCINIPGMYFPAS